jgi:hypothetical protein
VIILLVIACIGLAIAGLISMLPPHKSKHLAKGLSTMSQVRIEQEKPRTYETYWSLESRTQPIVKCPKCAKIPCECTKGIQKNKYVE